MRPLTSVQSARTAQADPARLPGPFGDGETYVKNTANIRDMARPTRVGEIVLFSDHNVGRLYYGLDIVPNLEDKIIDGFVGNR